MKLNKFSFCPVVEEVDGVEKFVKFIDQKETRFSPKKTIGCIATLRFYSESSTLFLARD